MLFGTAKNKVNFIIVWSHLYSLSFEQNPDWSREYSGQEEIHQYLIGIALKYGLYRHVRFNTTVDEARWSDTENKWKTKVHVGGLKEAEYYGSDYTITSDFLVSGVGQLNQPRFPDIEGLDAFKGKKMHSARWDWTYDLRGKKVGIIGNGATAAQIIPEVAKQAASMTVFQRTPNWVVPRDDKAITDTMKTIYRYIPAVRRRYRAQLMDLREQFYNGAVVRGDSGQDDFKAMTIALLEKQIPSKPELRKKLLPNYSPGCKRIIISDDFYPAFDRDNVTLETDKISHITENGIETTTGTSYDFDVLILATGFRTVEFMYPINIIGAGGRSIGDIWKSGARAYLGITVEDLPNFGMLYGPNTNLGHNSIILMIEAQSKYINALIKPVLAAKKEGDTLKLTPKTSRVVEFNTALQAHLSESTFADPACNSWYKNSAGLITNNWSSTVVDYQKKTENLDFDDYDISGSGAQDVKGKKEHIGRVVEETQTVTLLGGIATLATLAAVGSFVLSRSPGLLRRIRA
jgi:cation diffusion facilitator CzcD-associated flavoprotein CzcO